MPPKADKKCLACGAGLRRQYSKNGTCDGECDAAYKSTRVVKFAAAVMRTVSRQ